MTSEEGEVEHDLEAGTAAGPSDENDAGKSLEEQLAARARQEAAALVAQVAAAPPGTRILNEHGEDMRALLRGSKFLGPNGQLLPVEASLSHGQAKDFVDDSRGRRFWVYKTEEEQAAVDAASSHDCVRGSLLLVACGPFYVALARVVRLGTLSGSTGKAVCKSIQLKPGDKQQWFKLELCVVEEVEVASADEADDGAEATMCLQFKSSGLQLPHSTGERVIKLVSRSVLHAIEGKPYATMSRDDELALRRSADGRLRPWLKREHISALQPLEAEVPLPDESICFNCHVGWGDESTGPLLACKGSCKRAFHAGCRPGFDDNQLCGLCSGKDEVVCGICRRDWSDPCKRSDYYTGELVLCDGGCNRAFHQLCHCPPISDEAVASDNPFICLDCSNDDTEGAGPAAGPAATATAIPTATAAAAPTARTGTATVTPAAAPGKRKAAAAVDSREKSTATSSAPPAVALGRQALTLSLTRGSEGRLGFGLNDSNMVDKLTPGGAAERGGMLLGDCVTGVNGTSLAPGQQVAALLPKGADQLCQEGI